METFFKSLNIYNFYRGTMYWSHADEEAKIFRIESSALDGSSRRELLTTNKSTHSLTIDFASNRLYFVYQNSGIISYLDLATYKVGV